MRTAWGMGVWLTLASGCAPGCGEAPAELHETYVSGKLTSGDTVVTYRDGERVVGAIVEEGHRLPLEYDQLPLAWQVAVVAAEDGQFWHHGGTSVRGILRAVRDNLWAGTVVSGGSTITQQTIKLLLDRRERTFRAKWKELDYTWHLEGGFPKADILTFYSNGFHVTGTGSGLRVAARYFFDREPDELTLVETAFIAGQIQAPAEFDPFQGTEAQQRRTRERASRRTGYVLRRMRDERDGMLRPPGVAADDVRAIRQEATRLLDEGFTLTFQRGTFRYDSNSLVDEVQRRLDGPRFRKVLADAGVAQGAGGGLTVVTTLDEDVQREATWSMWHHLTELGLRLEGGGVGTLVVPAEVADIRPEDPRWTVHSFGLGTVTGQTGRGDVLVRVPGGACVLDASAVRRVASLVGASWRQVREAMPTGTKVWVSHRDPGHCDLEVVPELQGAAVVLEQGKVRALVGGNTNRDFDRTRALRQFGSAFKPMVFHAAMTLGWEPDDRLANREMPFTYSGTHYEPRRDHSAPGTVTLERAAATSENLASVWLLVHLLDRLSLEEIHGLAQQMGLARENGESRDRYETRLRQAGIEVSGADLSDIAARTAAMEYAEDFPGRGETIMRWVSDAASLGRLEGAVDDCEQQVSALFEAMAARQVPVSSPDVVARETPEGWELGCGLQWEGFEPVQEVFAGVATPEPSTRQARRQRRDRRRERAVVGARRRVSAGLAPLPVLPPLEQVYVASAVKLAEVRSLQARRSRALTGLRAADIDVLSPDVLYRHGDLRTQLALRYIQHLASRYGVLTELQPVLSLPLGTSELTLQELTALYAGLVSGQARLPPHAADVGPTLLIQEIRDHRGRVIFQAEAQTVAVVHPQIGDQTAGLLRKVVESGTGRRAKGSVKVQGTVVPLGGKTGTTNDYRNAAFVGFLPGPGPDGYDATTGHLIGVYVGYDDNREMQGRGLKVGGSVGALPPFRSIAAALGRQLEGAPLPTAREDTGGWPLRVATGDLTRTSGSLEIRGH